MTTVKSRVNAVLACCLALVMIAGATEIKGTPVPPQTAAVAPRKLFLKINHVKAVKECRGPFGTAGADSIDLGAVVIDPVDGVRRRTLDIGHFGHDGSVT